MRRFFRWLWCVLFHWKCHECVGRGYVGYWLMECRKCHRRYFTTTMPEGEWLLGYQKVGGKFREPTPKEIQAHREYLADADAHSD